MVMWIGVFFMIVTCPNCLTKFNFPDSQGRPNTKLRCSVCKHIFPLIQEEQKLSFNTVNSSKSSSGGEKKKKWSSTKKLLLLFILLTLTAGIYAWYTYPQLKDVVQHFLFSEKKEEPTDLISLIALRDVVQYNINNEKLGNISVIEGKVVNGFSDPRELIRLEASLYDKNGKLLVSKEQLAGTSVSLFQLQVLGEQELERALTNKIDILANNTNIPPKGEVPFMIVFYNPPDNAAEFGVKVIDARLPPK
ncbi:zinc-ribbon domain-containing protein [Lawsonia intracellularis]|uniref:Zinc finger/thioredoxin putative domain-containing protein n=2 Tax=Lawsonia intracellularis TaxID=29546 RepID=Q1MQQ8_LAWIP|nr:Zinc finger-domain-containing protein [Lawsonia intracellularis N343]KAA0204729.1 DUF3426 domain-containing protein [Lawsonia intracellularis]CAJ54669.1 hypothetical protein LI0615 [Lawsonia intracellularis PHE/MN1-00]MBZ3893096.1 zinc-ribbon domain-containing protein [Lawsonia intracellularis]RBN33358.1 DUF3426 domain-containing protein [Lawsonia intracellularis]